MMSTQAIFTFISLLFCGLIAGLLFSYSCSVNLGLKALNDNEYIKAMAAINAAIKNPVFLIPFTGLCLLLPITTYINYTQQSDGSFYLMLIATIIYCVGVFGITILCNVPLNEQLAKFSIQSATTNEISVMRHAYENSWNTYHSIRTIASVISFALIILSLIKTSQ